MFNKKLKEEVSAAKLVIKETSKELNAANNQIKALTSDREQLSLAFERLYLISITMTEINQLITDMLQRSAQKPVLQELDMRLADYMAHRKPLFDAHGIDIVKLLDVKYVDNKKEEQARIIENFKKSWADV